MVTTVRRASHAQMQARRRAGYLAARIGRALREARLNGGLRQRQVADVAGISQAYYSRIERGKAESASLDTLATCAAAVGTQLTAFLEALPGSSLPGDLEHIRRQQALIALAATAGWHATPERPIDPDASRSRSIDVYLERRSANEVAVVEIVNLVLDAGAVLRGLSDKASAVRRELGPEWRVAAVLVVRATSRNRRLVGSLADLFQARFPGRSADWLAALARPGIPMPPRDGFLWTRATTPELMAARLSARRRVS